MTKAELIEKIAKDVNLPKTTVSTMFESFMKNVTTELKKKDGKLTLVGFGTFLRIKRKPRTGRNPQTGSPIKIKASETVKFRPSKNLK